MAFWGAVIKPGQPLYHAPGGPKLRLTQATLDNSSNGNSVKCSIQCTIDGKAPVNLCNLIPNTCESCQIHAEFQEPQNVTFSVIGPMAVHLIGYFKHSGGDNNDSVSYGEDICQSESEASLHSSEDEEAANDSFINDGDPEEDIDSELDSVDETIKRRSKRKKANQKRLRKTYVSESDSDHQDSGADATPLIDLEVEDKDVKLQLAKDKKDVVADSSIERQSDNLDKETVLDNNGKHTKLAEEDDDGFFFSGSLLTFPKPLENRTRSEVKNKRYSKVQTKGNALEEKRDNDALVGDGEQVSLKSKSNKRKRKSKTEETINVEQLEVGLQKGKVASLGKKVKVSYTGKWKASGKVFDSNVDDCPLSFKLGNEGVMEEWNIALNGRQSGDSVRLTIPHPVWKSSGSCEVALIPPPPPNVKDGESDKGVVYDIKVLKVRKN